MVEDEEFIALPTEEILVQNNYSVDLAFDGEEGLYFGLTNLYDLILLDWMLPKMDGKKVCRQLRANGITAPILMLTARGETLDKIEGLDAGADDYLAKPFDYEELLARIRALSRRHQTLEESHQFTFANLVLNQQKLTLQTEFGMEKLTLKEAQLLELLIRRGKMTTPKGLIIEKIWGFEENAKDSNVEYHVSRLRHKLKLVQAKAAIQSIRGIGYVLKEESHG